MRSSAVLIFGGFALAAAAVVFVDYLYYSRDEDKCLAWHFEPTEGTSRGNATQPRMTWVCHRWASQQDPDTTGQISN
jgi:hypothetical protein